MNEEAGYANKEEWPRACYRLGIVGSKMLLEQFAAFVESAVGNVAASWARMAVKRMKITDISGHLNSFDPQCKTDFQQKTDANGQAVVAYNAIQSNRHMVAHALGPNTTLAELEAYFHDSKPVLVAIAEALNLAPAEIAALTWP